MLPPTLKRNDRLANVLILLVSFIVFGIVASLHYIRMHMHFDLGPDFDVHIFASINAFLNATVAILLVVALLAVKRRKYLLHKRLMLAALALSVLFLVSYIAHHLLAGETIFPKDNSMRGFYIFILLTHIFLAAIILPFILFTAYRSLISDFPRHKKLARITWPIWFYVAVTGVIVYLMISPYYT